jgi:GNAT superfamily N-acetyltransferase
MNGILHDASPDTLSGAIEENVRGFFRLFRSWPRAEVYDGPDMLYTLTDIPFSVFNSVVDARLEPESADAAIELSIALHRARNVPMLWITGPSTRPADLGERLVAYGFLPDEDEPQMAVDLAAMHEDFTPPSTLSIAQVFDVGTLARWCWVYNAGFGMPAIAEPAWFDLLRSVGLGPDAPVRHFLGRLEGVPVATSSLFLTGGVAGIGAVTTLPEARRQGVAAAMVLTALREGRAAGYRFGVLGASEMGMDIYLRIGFREVCRMRSYVWTCA